MSDQTNHTEHTGHHSSSDGSTDVTESDKEYTEELGDGSASGDTQDSQGDTDFVSGGDPEGE
ncbi:hypothetical protein [Frondihabitans peucedani]|uniref:Uncharacterized protein n=1 Tax=Frondihabitans peucedani TaxID=598626 RepID=A0ABP8DX33_9MICO